MRELRRNTAVIVTVGPFYDKADGVTPETGLTITNERITLAADTDDGAAPTNILDNVTGATSGTNNDLNYITGNDAAMMQLELSAANLNRLGRVKLAITDAANHCPVIEHYMIVTEEEYDRKCGADTGPVPEEGIQDRGVLQSVTGTGGVLRDAAAFGDDTLKGSLIGVLGTDQGYWQYRFITTNALTGDTFTVDPAFAVTPTGANSRYKIFAGAPASDDLAFPVDLISILGVAPTLTGDQLDVNVDNLTAAVVTAINAAVLAVLPAALTAAGLMKSDSLAVAGITLDPTNGTGGQGVGAA